MKMNCHIKNIATLIVLSFLLRGCSIPAESQQTLSSDGVCNGDGFYKEYQRYIKFCTFENPNPKMLQSCYRYIATSFKKLQPECQELVASEALSLTYSQLKRAGSQSLLVESDKEKFKGNFSEFMIAFDIWYQEFSILESFPKAKNADLSAEFGVFFNELLLVSHQAINNMISKKVNPFQNAFVKGLDEFIPVLDQLTSLPLYLAVIGPAIEAQVQAIENSTKIYDLMCVLGRCPQGEAGYIEDIITFSHTINPDKSALLPSSKESALGQSIKRRSEQIHRLFSFDVDGDLDERDLLLWSPAVSKSVIALQRCKNLLNNKEKEGVFHSERNRKLHSGFDLESKGRIAIMAKNQAFELASELKSYQGNVSARIEAKIIELQTNLKKDSIHGEMAIIEQRMKAHERDLIEIKRQYELDTLQKGDYLNAAVIEHVIGQEKSFSYRPLDPFSVKGSESRYQKGTRPSLITDVAKEPLISAKKGQMLRFSVTGKWAPVCALRNSQYKELATNQAIEIGSEGFYLHHSSGGQKIRSRGDRHAQGDFSSNSDSFSGSVGVGANFYGVFANAGRSFTTSSGVNNQKEASFGTSSSESITRDAQFTGGMRLLDTPFPNLGAASLLVVMLPLGSTNLDEIIEIQQVRSDGLLPVSRDADLYLVVNDCKGDEIPGEPSLNISILVGSPESSTAQIWITKMLAGVEEYKKKGGGIVGEAHDTSLKLSLLRTSLKSRLMTEVSFELQAIANSHLSMFLERTFDAWLDFETKNLLRQGEIAELGKAMMELKLELTNLQKASDGQGNLMALESVRTSILASPDFHLLNVKQQNATLFIMDVLLPLIKFYMPESISRFTEVFGSKSLLNNTNEDFLNQNTVLVEILKLGAEVLEESNLKDSLSWQYMISSIMIPKPGIEAPKSSPAIRDPVRARQIWDLLFAKEGGNVVRSFNINFDDLYSNNMTQSLHTLRCQTTKPIVSDVMVFLGAKDAVAGDELAQRIDGHTLFSHMGPEQSFPFSEGPKELRLANPLWAQHYLELRVVNNHNYGFAIQQALEHHTTHVAATGLSPFTNYQMLGSLSFLREPHFMLEVDDNGYPTNIDYIIFGYRLRANNSNSGSLDWIKSCGN